ncbi:MAG: FAD-dependent oxidoreductase [Desulfobacteraceae bacterium]|nr:FAD-dependent oxidoreductase [Desulfobacteraceae bacterium]
MFQSGGKINKNINIVIVGGGPAVVIAALTAKNFYPDKSVLLIKDIGHGVIPCAIPYMVYTLNASNNNAMGNLPLENAGIKILVDKAIDLDAGHKMLSLKPGQKIQFEKLILATCSLPVEPPVPGIRMQGVFGIEKSFSHNTKIREKAKKANHIVLIGIGGQVSGGPSVGELINAAHQALAKLSQTK